MGLGEEEALTCPQNLCGEPALNWEEEDDGSDLWALAVILPLAVDLAAEDEFESRPKGDRQPKLPEG